MDNLEAALKNLLSWMQMIFIVAVLIGGVVGMGWYYWQLYVVAL